MKLKNLIKFYNQFIILCLLKVILVSKICSKLLSLCDDEVRLPLVKVTETTKEIVKKALQSANLI